MPYRNKTTGEEITDQEYQSMFPDNAQQDQLPQAPRLSFGQRAKLSFGGPAAIEELKASEEEAGLRGKIDIGDIADVAGSAIPAAGAALGSPFGPIGVGVGTAIGTGIKNIAGRLFGVRGDTSRSKDIAVDPILSGVIAGTGQKVLGATTKYIASRIPKLLGIFTADDNAIVNAALRNPQAADLGIEQGDDALRKVVIEGGRNSINLRTAFIKSHSESINNDVFKGVAVSRGYGQAVKQDITNKFFGFLRGNNVKYVNGKFDFSTSKIKANPGEISKINDAAEAILSWKNWSQKGVHELKQLIGSLTKFPKEAGGTSKSPLLGRMYGYLNSKVKESLPSGRRELYSQINKKFEDNIDLFDDLVEAFNHGKPFSRIAQVFTNNNDSMRTILKFYDQKTGIDVAAIQAGRELAREQKAAFSFINPRSWADFFISPHTQGRIVTRYGKIQQGGEKYLSPRFRTGVRSVVSEEINKLFR